MTRAPVDLREDRGVVLILGAVAMFAILFTLAIVIDMGATRSVRRSTRLALDAGATSGALSLPVGGTSLEACRHAFEYTFSNLGGSQPTSGQITSACTTAGLHTACATGSAARTATLTVDGRTVSITNPVPDGSPLMSATAVGGGSTQAVDATADGVPCDRIGVEVTRPQERFFGPGSGNYTVHGVARYSRTARPNEVAPGLVALSRTRKCAIDVGNNGKLILRASPISPGVAFSDSDGSGSGCTGSSAEAIVSSKNAARVVAESSNGMPGELTWVSAPTSVGYYSGGTFSMLGTESTANSNYTGFLHARPEPITRNPVDLAYNCAGATVPTGSTCTGTDFVSTSHALATATTPPAGYTVYSGPCTTASAPIVLAGSTNWWVTCPTFTVKDNPLLLEGGGTVVFKGSVVIEAGGTFAANISDTATPTVDAEGYLVPAVSSRQTTVVLSSTAATSLDMQSTSSRLALSQTAMYSLGGFKQQGSPTMKWTPPTDGLGKGLLWWSESTQQLAMSGSPQIRAKGVFFHPNGQALMSGGGEINLLNMQMWLDYLTISGTGTVRLSADFDSSIKTAGTGSALIR